VPAAWREHCIAQILSQQNRRTATGLPFRKAHVRELRAYHSIPGCQPPPENVTHGCQEAAVVSIAQAARQLGVSSATIYRWLRDGFIAGEQLTPGAPWQIRVDQQLRDMVRPQAPDGWLPLSQAATRPGVEFPRPGVTGGDRSELCGVLAEIEALGLDLLEIRRHMPKDKSSEPGDDRSP
jgi:excisionase family DNA binding protein